eukprot:TRINITY_DN9912_c0_g1_i6.p1 TRINITY_DN9912_c0_g1~~TRINITY_DN9912_c0_g1_i6.p1  ORF type:complete len:152 (-),score=41.07 TRINITY_DN9912_c0_g1_i6:45-500(-)
MCIRDSSNRNPLNPGRKSEARYRVLRGSGKVASTNFKCHICRLKKDGGKVLVCINFQTCRHSYCHGCIDRSFRTKAKKEYLKVGETNWPCFACRGLCKCKKCRKALFDELQQLDGERERARRKESTGELGGRKRALHRGSEDEREVVQEII